MYYIIERYLQPLSDLKKQLWEKLKNAGQSEKVR